MRACSRHAPESGRSRLQVIEGRLELSKELTRLTHTAACALAKANRRAEALIQVKRALDDDYFGCEQMERDKDLDSIRRTQPFKALFAKWRAKSIERHRGGCGVCGENPVSVTLSCARAHPGSASFFIASASAVTRRTRRGPAQAQLWKRAASPGACLRRERSGLA